MRFGTWAAFGGISVTVGVAAAIAPLPAIALALACCYVALSLVGARVALTMWVVGICAAPAWLGLSAAGSFWEVGALLSILSVPSMIVHRGAFTPNTWDLIPIAFVISCVAATFVGSPPAMAMDILVLGAAPYMVSRILVPAAGFDWMYRTLTLVLAAVAVLAILEFVLDIHPFVGLFPSSPIGFWSELQTRGGAVRSEVTFGHAIALGGALAMAIPLALGASFKPGTKLALLTVLGLGILSTASRGPILAAFLGVLLMLATGGQGTRIRGRMSILIVMGVLAALFLAFLAPALSDSEAVVRADYRSNLYEAMLPALNLFGAADSFSIGVNGATTFQGFTSIESSFLQIALPFGLIPLSLAVLGLAINGARVVVGRSSPPGVALLALSPLFLSVSLIAQYYPLVWFLVGLTVAAGRARGRDVILRRV